MTAIISVGIDVPHTDVEVVPHDKRRSLADADLVLFDMDLGEELVDLAIAPTSRLLMELEHWRHELDAAAKAGKTVVVFLTGYQKYSVDGHALDSTSVLPFTLPGVRCHTGTRVVAGDGIGALRPYWKLCKRYSEYRLSFDRTGVPGALVARGSDRVVGSVITHALGHFVLVPALVWPKEFEGLNECEDGVPDWTEQANSFGRQFVETLVALDKTLRSGSTATPEPSWAKDDQYVLCTERKLRASITEVAARIEALQQEHSKKQWELEDAGGLRRLLYESGKPLEAAVLEALTLIGFKAERYDDGDSEFDAVFSSPEGEFLGEVEGKDNKAIDVTKYRQLADNVQADFRREDVAVPKTGVLFGNACRLTPPDARGEFFTEKCRAGAREMKIALVRTPDLFRIAKYLKKKRDKRFAQQCRRALLEGAGDIVRFPETPNNERRAHSAAKKRRRKELGTD